MPVQIGVLRETAPGERRVSMVPRAMELLGKSGVEFLVESGAGEASGVSDGEYKEKGAQIAASRDEVLERARVILQVRANLLSGVADSRHTVIGFADPLSDAANCAEIAARGATLFAMELMPRITRAQSMDALSSMATIAGYKAVIMAADRLPRMFPLLMTAAGTVAPARVFVLGAGVAGLQAIATARRLGAVVSAYDVRPAVKEQVESLGAKFVALELEPSDAEDKGGYAKALGEDFYRRQRELLTGVLRQHDVVVTTAAVPGKKAPVLLTAEMVRGMPPGSVIVDLAAERGGNCELTRPGETVIESGVMILGPLNLPSEIPYHASQMYARNVAAFLKHLVKDGELRINLDDEITRETLVAREGKVVHPRVLEMLGQPV